MRFIYSLYLGLAILVCPTKGNAQAKYPNTFLWRISGNGLQKPSFLYGTMHLQDKRLFYFTDSLYHAIESTEGFAMELDPDAMMDSLLNQVGNDENSPLVKNIMGAKQFNKIAKQLKKKYKISADRLTTKDIMDERKHQMYYQTKDNNMPTIIDMYLFNIAQKQGKWTGGIEDVNDQLSLTDESGATMTPEDVVNYNDDSVMSTLERMKRMYINQDLTGIDSLFNTDGNASKDLQIITRNKKMARRIDSISAIRTCFFAVGCAHLPGDSGVIALLQHKGFTVEPVLSNNKIAPEKYIAPIVKEKEWIKVEDDNDAYSVEMPGKPSEMNIGGGLTLKMYVDLVDITAYGSGVFANGGDSDMTNISQKIINVYKSKGYSLLEKKAIEMEGVKGMELMIENESTGYFLIRILQYQNKLFFIIEGRQKKELFSSPDAVRFLQSFKLNKDALNYYTQWRKYSDSTDAFSILVPGKGNEKPLIRSNEKGDFSKVYTYPDLKEGSYYITVVKELGPTHYMENDCETFKENKTALESEGGSSIDTSMILLNGFPACRYDAVMNKGKEETALQALYLIRGSRTYYAVAITPMEKKDFPEVTNFFRSFTLLPFDTTGWRQQDENNGYSIYAPDMFFKNEDTTAANTIAQIFYYKDKNSGEGFIVEKIPIPKFYWAQNDSLLWVQKKQYVSDNNDTLIQFNSFKKPNCIGADFLVNHPDSRLKKKMRYIITGDTIYCIYAFLTDELMNDKNVKRFFDEFTVTNLSPLTIFNSKAKQLLDSLNSTDSTERATAETALTNADFSREDLPLLHAAFLKDYPNDTTNNITINENIQIQLIALNDSTTVDFIQQHYVSVPDNELPMLMLEILAKQQTKKSYAVLKKLLFERIPHSRLPYKLTNVLTDSLELSRTFFPEAGSLFADSLLGPCFARLANKLIDSNKLSINLILNNSANLLELAKKQYSSIKYGDDYGIYTKDIIQLLGKYNFSAGNDMLQKFTSQKVMYYVEPAIIGLLKNNQVVNQAEINKVAADIGERIEFYEDLKAIKKENLFPDAFRSQQKFAESYLHNTYTDDDNGTIEKLDFLNEKIIDSNGIKKRYFLFKITYNNNGVKSSQLGVCGPFNMDVKDFDPNYQTLQVWQNNIDNFSPKEINSQFEIFLSAGEADK